MDNDIFQHTDKVLINSIKHSIETSILAKNIFWNGVITDCVIAGGVFASRFNNETEKDIDVFILNKNVSVYAHLTDNPATSDQWRINDKDAGTYLQNPRIYGTATNLTTKVQYIITDYTSREELVADFDYVHCKVSYDPNTQKLYITRGAYQAIRNKLLIAAPNKATKYWRTAKFISQGWTPSHVHTADDHLKGLNDSFQSVIQQSVNDMLKRIKEQKGMLPTLDEKDIDIEAFHQLIK
jgi:hypothetical protein